MLEWFVKISNTCKDVNIMHLYHLCRNFYNYYKIKNMEVFKNEFSFLSFEKTMKDFFLLKFDL